MKQILARFERDLDPMRPHAQVLAYGEVSAALLIPDLPGQVAKRMAGFADESMAGAYVRLVEEYIEILNAAGIEVVSTEPVVVPRPSRPPVVYLVQPLLTDLGNALLEDSDLKNLIVPVLDRVWSLHQRRQSPEVAIDAQLSNWSFRSGVPVLIDVGTPFMRDHGKYLFDEEILLSAIPAVARWYYRRKGSIGAYMDDYFDVRLVAVDLLGNFLKEGAERRLRGGVDVVNEWLATHRLAPVTTQQVREYYGEDAATLELFGRVRRIDRAGKRLLRQPYDFVLPGRVAR